MSCVHAPLDQVADSIVIVIVDVGIGITIGAVISIRVVEAEFERQAVPVKATATEGAVKVTAMVAKSVARRRDARRQQADRRNHQRCDKCFPHNDMLRNNDRAWTLLRI
jgi:hypothetical protein